MIIITTYYYKENENREVVWNIYESEESWNGEMVYVSDIIELWNFILVGSKNE